MLDPLDKIGQTLFLIQIVNEPSGVAKEGQRGIPPLWFSDKNVLKKVKFLFKVSII